MVFKIIECSSEQMLVSVLNGKIPQSVRKIEIPSGGGLYNIKFVRTICRDIAREKDPEKAEELMGLLCGIMKQDREEFKARIQFLIRRYSHLLTKINAE